MNNAKEVFSDASLRDPMAILILLLLVVVLNVKGVRETFATPREAQCDLKYVDLCDLKHFTYKYVVTQCVCR